MKYILILKYNKDILDGDRMNVCDFGTILRHLRKSHNLTQKELGAHVGLSKAVVSKYETGIGYPSFDILILIANYFSVTTDYLLGVEKHKTLDVSELSDTQIDTVRRVIAEFSKCNQKK